MTIDTAIKVRWTIDDRGLELAAFSLRRGHSRRAPVGQRRRP